MEYIPLIKCCKPVFGNVYVFCLIDDYWKTRATPNIYCMHTVLVGLESILSCMWSTSYAETLFDNVDDIHIEITVDIVITSLRPSDAYMCR